MSESSDTGEQLVSFFLYSLFIYPVTNYIVSPQRKYPRWKAALYAILFLAGVATLHLMYENSEKGPNYYQLLQIRRDTPMSMVKKAYRSLSLELHPDKNKAANAADEFRKIQQAFDVITDKSKRRDYELLGEHGIKLSSQMVIDQKYLLLQLIIYYASSLIFAFLMTFSETTSDAFQLSIFGLSSMFLVELLLILKEIDLPATLFPYTTSHEFISILHRLFPAFMNGCRCLTGAFYQDRKALREKALDELSNMTKDITMKCDQISHSMQEFLHIIHERRKKDIISTRNGDGEPIEEGEVEDIVDGVDGIIIEGNVTADKVGLIEKVLQQKKIQFNHSKEGREGSLATSMQQSLTLIEDPIKLGNKMLTSMNSSTNGWILLRNVLIYLLARYFLIKGK